MSYLYCYAANLAETIEQWMKFPAQTSVMTGIIILKNLNNRTMEVSNLAQC